MEQFFRCTGSAISQRVIRNFSSTQQPDYGFYARTGNMVRVPSIFPAVRRCACTAGRGEGKRERYKRAEKPREGRKKGNAATQPATVSRPGKEGEERRRRGERRRRRRRRKRSAGYGNGTVSRGIRGLRDCFGRAPISTALWAAGGICGRPRIYSYATSAGTFASQVAAASPLVTDPPSGFHPLLLFLSLAPLLFSLPLFLTHTPPRGIVLIFQSSAERAARLPRPTDHHRHHPRPLVATGSPPAFSTVRAWYNGYTVLCIGAGIEAMDTARVAPVQS